MSKKRDEDYINDALDRVYACMTPECRMTLRPDSKFIVFSDHHKGGRNGADDFVKCEPAYLAALAHYLREGYYLVVLGDAEELLEERIPTVLQQYRNVLDAEAGFHQKGRYTKIFGNHDDKWRKPRLVKKHLHPIFPGLQVQEGLVLEYHHPESGALGQIMLVHGHQGTLTSDRIQWLARIGVFFYKFYQIITRKGRTGPSRDFMLRARHDRDMYMWSTTRKQNFVLVTGHTHRPVWSSVTHVEKLAQQLREEKKELNDLSASPAPSAYGRSLGAGLYEKVRKIVDITTLLKEKMTKYYSPHDTVKTFPTYFNTGCCRFSDGNITGIEITDTEMRLVKWEADLLAKDQFVRQELESDELAHLFTDMDVERLLKTTRHDLASMRLDVPETLA